MAPNFHVRFFAVVFPIWLRPGLVTGPSGLVKDMLEDGLFEDERRGAKFYRCRKLDAGSRRLRRAVGEILSSLPNYGSGIFCEED